MLEFVLRPLRQVLGAGEREVSKPFDDTEHEILDAVEAIQRTSDSIDRHVRVIEGLATSVAPLTESVDRLTATVADLVTMLAPLAGAEHEVQRAEGLFRFRRHEHKAASEAGPPPPPEPGPAREPASALEPGPPDA
jgi:hypothetical protein